MNSDLFKNVIYKICSEILYLLYMFYVDLALKNLQWLMCPKTKPIVAALELFRWKEQTQRHLWLERIDTKTLLCTVVPGSLRLIILIFLRCPDYICFEAICG